MLLAIIYISFISLGLPDSLLGAAWPVMRIQLGASLPAAGAVSMIVTACTVVSSLLSGRVGARFGAGRVTAASVLMTAAALLGMALSPSLWALCACAVPLGLGAGAVDAVLNGFVALHYKAHHMSWLHCFWGVGATAGPVILSLFIAGGLGWRGGYGAISALQFLLAAALFAMLRLWRRFDSPPVGEESGARARGRAVNPLRVKGAAPALLYYFSYAFVEMTTGLWGASFLADAKGLPPDVAARWASAYFIGITAGRFTTGFLTMRFAYRRLIAAGIALCGAGALLMLPPLPAAASLAGLLLMGAGSAPVFPGMLHETPSNFGAARAQAMMGYQMASSYVGAALVPPLFGLISNAFGIWLLPFYVLLGVLLLTATSARIFRQ